MMWRRTFAHTFDLKGNQRNRYVRDPSPGQVLHDMNFFEVMGGLPLSLEASRSYSLLDRSKRVHRRGL